MSGVISYQENSNRKPLIWASSLHLRHPTINIIFAELPDAVWTPLSLGVPNQMPRWLRGHGGYVMALLPLLLKLPAYAMRLTEFNGEDRGSNEKPTLLAAFANTQFYGDGMCIAPEADFTDGKLDVCRISTMNPVELFCMFPTIYFGQHRLSPKVEYSKAERVFLESETPLEIYADGEFVCETPAEISIAAGALRVIKIAT